MTIKKLISLFATICFFLNACPAACIAEDFTDNGFYKSRIQEYDYTNLDLKALNERIKQFKEKISTMDLSKGLDEETLNELYEIDRQYKAFKALEFNKDTGEIAIPPRSKMTFKLNK